MDIDIQQQKEEFMAAYEWMLDVQRRLMFTPVFVSVETHYTPAIGEWSLTLWINRKGRELISVDYRPWNKEEFYPQKKYIEGFLEGFEEKEE